MGIHNCNDTGRTAGSEPVKQASSALPGSACPMVVIRGPVGTFIDRGGCEFIQRMVTGQVCSMLPQIPQANGQVARVVIRVCDEVAEQGVAKQALRPLPKGHTQCTG